MCGGCKKSHQLHLSVVIFFWSFGINGSNTLWWEKPVLGAWGMLHFSLPLMNRLNKTEQFSPFYFGLVALEGSTFTRIIVFLGLFEDIWTYCFTIFRWRVSYRRNEVYNKHFDNFSYANFYFKWVQLHFSFILSFPVSFRWKTRLKNLHKFYQGIKIRKYAVVYFWTFIKPTF